MPSGKIINFTEIAYNAPILIQIDMSSVRQVQICIDGVEYTNYVMQCKYHGIDEEISFGKGMYSRLVNVGQDMVYLFSHSKTGCYSGVPRYEYFKNEVCYDFVTKEEFERLKELYK